MTNTAAAPKQPVLAARFLETALLLTILAHALAMTSMALLLLPGMPGGMNPLASRIAYLVNHPTLWRVGWLPWHLTALSDVLLAFALLRTRWIPRPLAILVVVTTLIALAIEQPNELAWELQGVALAQTALQTGNFVPYTQFEAQTYLLVAAWAAIFYTITACLWSVCFARARVWQRGLTALSVVLWGLLLAASVAPLLPAPPNAAIIAAGNAIGFVLMLIWFGWVAELVLRRSRPASRYGRMAQWIHPRGDLLGRLFNRIANSRLARAYGEWSPRVAFTSDITNVIYVNYLVEADRLAPLVPWGLELQRLGEHGQYALFTHLTYQHGHFRPTLLDGLRRWMPSPIQSNWRIYVRDPATRREGIYFVTTAMSQTLPALLARLLSEGVPMHVVWQGAVTPKADGSFEVCLDPGSGSAPDLIASLKPVPTPTLTSIWRDCFASFHDLIAYCVPQDRAMASQTWYRRVSRQEIDLGIPLDACEPLDGTVVSNAAQALVGDAAPICFRVAQVAFHFKQEAYDFKP